ncbi:phosphorylase superfamily protein [Colletotrichum tofieldiae]|nr:phosphorylase superfamily protein [Colletotrichum tofieldiae]GKT80113.1 phosphorylase superfamily protein [Colletotrichum tofieldiae]
MVARPSRRDEFEVAVICALPLEYDAAALAFDEFWDNDGDTYGRALKDSNIYTPGRIGQYNVVLALLPMTNKVSAASTIASLRSSYANLRLVIFTGICYGVPNPGTNNEIVLGDVVISKTLIQYDYSRQSAGKFIQRDTLYNKSGRPSTDIQSLLATLQTSRGRDSLQHSATQALNQIQENAVERRQQGAKYVRPSASDDKLFTPGYQHKHQNGSDCGCVKQACKAAQAASCDELGCDIAELVPRERLQEVKESEDNGANSEGQFEIHIGCIGSGGVAMKSGEDRNKVAREQGLIAFEMEEADVRDELPCLIVQGVIDYADSHRDKSWQSYAAATAIKSGEDHNKVAREQGLIAFEMEEADVWDELPWIAVKGVCDYADSHKNKKWQAYAAATAASVMKALLARYIQTDQPASDRNSAGALTTPSSDLGRISKETITGKHVVAGQHTSGGTTTTSFAKCRAETHITEDAVKAAAGNQQSGQATMGLLLTRRGTEVGIPQESVRVSGKVMRFKCMLRSMFTSRQPAGYRRISYQCVS